MKIRENSPPSEITNSLSLGQTIQQKSEYNLHRKLDRLFIKLLTGEWLAAVICALYLSPRSWNGSESTIHIHLAAALLLGGSITLVPIYLAVTQPGTNISRQAIAIGQMAFSALFIHLTSGRIETHFHIFGSLAFLMFYRDWKVLVTGSVVTLLDHILRGFYFPASIYGISSVESWRWLEHSTWIVFEDIFLILACVIGRREMSTISADQAKLEMINDDIERQIRDRTIELAVTHHQLDKERAKSLESGKISALSDMAGGLAHEINNPLAIISIRARHIRRLLDAPEPDLTKVTEYARIVETTADRIRDIVVGLRTFSKQGDLDPFLPCDLMKIISSSIQLRTETFKASGIQIIVKAPESALICEIREPQISQVLLHLLSNSYDALISTEEKWIQIEVIDRGSWIEIRISDSGSGIEQSIRDQIMFPFFTTKAVGTATGLGLCISKGIIEMHNGIFFLDRETGPTLFIIALPKSRTIPLEFQFPP